jgi:hypothetical protein
MDPTQLQNMYMLQQLMGQSGQGGMTPGTNPMMNDPTGAMSGQQQGALGNQQLQQAAQPMNPLAALMNQPPAPSAAPQGQYP